MADTNPLDQETVKLLKEFPNMWDNLQKQLDLKSKGNADTVRNIEAEFAKIQDGVEALQKAHATVEKTARLNEEYAKAAEAKADKAASRLSDLELELAKRGSSSSGDESKEARNRRVRENDPEYKNFFLFLKKGDRDSSLDLKTLRTDVNTGAGFLIPQVMDVELHKNIVEKSPLRMYVRNRIMPSKSMDITRRTSIGRAYYEGEGEEAQNAQSTYVAEGVTAARLTAVFEATEDMLISSAFDLEMEIMADVSEEFARGEGYAGIHGTGHKGPKGIVADSRVPVTTTATTGVLAFDDLATVVGAFKSGQRPMWAMNRATLAECWKMKGSDGHPIWTPVAWGQAGVPTLFGYPYEAGMIDLDSHVPATSNTKPIIFGDFFRGYHFFDLTGTSVIRDNITKAGTAITKWTFRRYNTGQVVLPEAFCICKIK